MDFQKNDVPAAKQVYKRFFYEPNSALRVLFVGNSITRHDPKPSIGWYRDCGMEASCLENDYVHQTEKLIREKCPDAVFGICHVSDFERGFDTMTDLEREFAGAAEFKGDIIVMFFGANVPSNKIDTPEKARAYTDAYENLRNTLAGERDVKVYHVEGFYDKPVQDKAKREIAEKYGDTYISLGEIPKTREYRGHFNHPNDEGMAAIAKCIGEVILKAL